MFSTEIIFCIQRKCQKTILLFLVFSLKFIPTHVGSFDVKIKMIHYNTLWGSHTLYTETKTNNDQHLVPINLAQRTNSVFWWPPPLLASLWRLDRFWVAAGQCLYREVREAGNSREGKTRQGVTIKATPKTGVQTIWLILVLFKLHPVKKKRWNENI